MAIVRSSSTRFVLNVESKEAMGMRILRMLLENFGLAVNLSVVLILLLAGDFMTTLYFPHDKECISGFKIDSSKFRRGGSSSNGVKEICMSDENGNFGFPTAPIVEVIEYRYQTEVYSLTSVQDMNDEILKRVEKAISDIIVPNLFFQEGEFIQHCTPYPTLHDVSSTARRIHHLVR